MSATVLRTATLELGRSTPRTPGQRASARAGVAACNADWHAARLTTHDERLRLGWDKWERAGYEIRWLELARTLPTLADVADLSRWETDGGALDSSQEDL